MDQGKTHLPHSVQKSKVQFATSTFTVQPTMRAKTDDGKDFYEALTKQFHPIFADFYDFYGQYFKEVSH